MIRLLKILLSFAFVLHMVSVGMGHFAPAAASIAEAPCPHHAGTQAPDHESGSLADKMRADHLCALKCAVVLHDLKEPPVFAIHLIRAAWPPAAPLASRAPPAPERPPRFV